MSLNVHQRLNEVRKAVGYIKKDKQIQTYMAVSHDAVVALTRDKLIENGVLVYPIQFGGEYEPKSEGDKMRLYKGEYDIVFVNCDEPADRIMVRIHGHAADTSDKAPGKAVTYATKSAILKVLMLETGENDESRVESTRTITEDQAATLDALIADVGADKVKFMKWAKVQSLDEISAKAYATCVGMLEQKRKSA